MPKTNNNWEKEFDKRFIVVIQNQQEQSRAQEEAKSFIRKTRHQAIQEVLGEVEEVIDNIPWRLYRNPKFPPGGGRTPQVPLISKEDLKAKLTNLKNKYE